MRKKCSRSRRDAFIHLWARSLSARQAISVGSSGVDSDTSVFVLPRRVRVYQRQSKIETRSSSISISPLSVRSAKVAAQILFREVLAKRISPSKTPPPPHTTPFNENISESKSIDDNADDENEPISLQLPPSEPPNQTQALSSKIVQSLQSCRDAHLIFSTCLTNYCRTADNGHASLKPIISKVIHPQLLNGTMGHHLLIRAMMLEAFFRLRISDDFTRLKREAANSVGLVFGKSTKYVQHLAHSLISNSFK